jgi:excinuclease UvrABC ATPase subunit
VELARAAETAPRFGAANRNGAIHVHGAREHNLKNIDLKIPREQLVVITGLSGSGKSTVAFDILFAEGQRRFLDSMSPYARQFVEQLEKRVAEANRLSPPLQRFTISCASCSQKPERSFVPTVICLCRNRVRRPL